MKIATLKKLIPLLFLLGVGIGAASAQIAAVNGSCSTGGVKVMTSGSASSTTVQASYPKCKVEVFLTGTTNHPSNIYADGSSTPLANPFTANANASWLFYSATTVGVDVIMTGGTPIPLPTPQAIIDIIPGGLGGGGAGNPCATSLTVQTANSGATAFACNPALTVDATGQTLQLAPTNPANGIGLSHSPVYNTSILNQQAFNLNGFYGGTGGKNFGNSPAAVNPIWTTSSVAFWNATFLRRGITGFLTGGYDKWATGDNGWGRCDNCYSVGGVTGSSDEGQWWLHANHGEMLPFFSGTANTNNSVGATSIAYTGSFTSTTTGITCDGCFLVDQRTSIASGHFTGPAVALGNYFSEPIDFTVTPSTAYGNINCNLPQSANQITPTTTVCSITEILGSTGTFVNGIASLSGPFSEQVIITNAQTPSGNTQTVTITHRNPALSSSGAMLWQGGTMQGTVQSHDFIESTIPQMETCFGAPDSTHLSCGIQLGGVLNPAPTGYFGTVALSGLTQSGTAVTGAFASGDSTLFSNLAAATASGSTGCSSGTLNGAATGITYNQTTGAIAWTAAGSASITCTGATLNLPATYAAFHVYPYAEQIASDNTATMALEPNIMHVLANDALVQPHPPTWSGVGVLDDFSIYNPNGGQESKGIYQLISGAGASNGFKAIHTLFQTPCNVYRGCGGVLQPPTGWIIQGPLGNIINSQGALQGFSDFEISCPVSGCHSTDVNSIIAVDGDSAFRGSITYSLGTQTWNFTDKIFANVITANSLKLPKVFLGVAGTPGEIDFSRDGTTTAAQFKLCDLFGSGNYLGVGNCNEVNEGPSPDGTLGMGKLESVNTTLANNLSVGLGYPSGIAAPVYHGTAGSESHQFFVTLVSPLGIEGVPSPYTFAATGGASTLGGSNFFSLVCPATLQPGANAGSTYNVSDFNITASTQKRYACPVGTTVTDDGTGTTITGTPVTNYNGVAGVGKLIFSPYNVLGGGTMRWQTGLYATTTDVGISHPSSGVLQIDGPTIGDGLGKLQAAGANFNGPGPSLVQIGTNVFSALPACAGGTEGTMAAVTDSTTATWGATVTGGSTNHIMAYCDGTNYTVMGK